MVVIGRVLIDRRPELVLPGERAGTVFRGALFGGACSGRLRGRLGRPRHHGGRRGRPGAPLAGEAGRSQAGGTSVHHALKYFEFFSHFGKKARITFEVAEPGAIVPLLPPVRAGPISPGP
jgi:hypothetical protein